MIYDDVQSHEYGIEIPIVDAVYRVLYQNANPNEVIVELMGRGLKSEHE